jgi:exonuclease SbcD
VSRIAFTADLHIDAYGQRVDPATGLNARLVDYLNTLQDLGEQANVCDALVVAGDFTERRHPAPWLVSQIRDRLSFGPSRQVYLQGNHDGAIAGGSIVTILDDGMDDVMDAVEERRVGVTRPCLQSVGFDCVLACIPFLDRHWLRAQPGMEHAPDDQVYQILSDQIVTIAAGLYAQAKRDYPDAGIVLVLHQTLAGAHMSESQQAFLGDRGTVVDAGRLAAIGFEGIVAGHLHRHQVLEGLACPVLYPGSIERVDYGEEREAKGFVIADVGPGRFDWRFVETPARRFLTIDCDQSKVFGPEDLAGAVVRAINLPPETNTADYRRMLEAGGAFEVTEIRKRPVAAPESAGGMSEAMSPSDALSEYFADDPDAAALIEEGRRLLAEVTV